MRKTKADLVREAWFKNPNLEPEEYAKLADCSVRTVQRNIPQEAFKKLANESKKSIIVKQPFHEVDINPEEVNPIKLLRDQLIKKCSMPDPDIRALESLMKLLEKTGKLDLKSQKEEEWSKQLLKKDMSDLVSIAIGNKTQLKDKSQISDDKDNLYQ